MKRGYNIYKHFMYCKSNTNMNLCLDWRSWTLTKFLLWTKKKFPDSVFEVNNDTEPWYSPIEYQKEKVK